VARLEARLNRAAQARSRPHRVFVRGCRVDDEARNEAARRQALDAKRWTPIRHPMMRMCCLSNLSNRGETGALTSLERRVQRLE
jgi:hypothetical protein